MLQPDFRKSYNCFLKELFGFLHVSLSNPDLTELVVGRRNSIGMPHVLRKLQDFPLSFFGFVVEPKMAMDDPKLTRNRDRIIGESFSFVETFEL